MYYFSKKIIHSVFTMITIMFICHIIGITIALFDQFVFVLFFQQSPTSMIISNQVLQSGSHIYDVES